jgi:hypothetical protein
MISMETFLPNRGDLLGELPNGFPAMVSSATEPLPRGDMRLAATVPTRVELASRKELVDLRWDQIDLEHALLHVRTQELQSCHAPIDR